MCRATALADDAAGGVRAGGRARRPVVHGRYPARAERGPPPRRADLRGRRRHGRRACRPGVSPRRSCGLARFAVAERAGAIAADVETRAGPGRRREDRRPLRHAARGRVLVARSVRALAPGAPWTTSLPDAVARYIAEHGLYGAQGAAMTPEELAAGGRALRRRQEGAGHRRARPARDRRLHGLLRDLLGRRPTARSRPSTTPSTSGSSTTTGCCPRRVEGVAQARWILMDYLDVVVHVFTPEARDVLSPRAAVGRGSDSPGSRARRS